jgi:hypothetical protein
MRYSRPLPFPGSPDENTLILSQRVRLSFGNGWLRRWGTSFTRSETMMKMTMRKIVKVGDLKEAEYNPPNRTSAERTRELEDSMELLGMLHPITTTPENSVVDGHRRLAVAKRLKWKEVECNVVHNAPEEVYASVNTTPRRMSGNDALGVWLKQPRAVTVRADKAFNKMTEVIGRVLVKKIYDAGCSMRVYMTAVHIARYCDDSTDETIQEVTAWLLEFATIGQVMKALEAGVNPRKIIKAIRAKEPIILKLDVA